MKRTASLFALLFLASFAALAADGDLPRRGFSGVQIAPTGDNSGVLVRGVVPGSGAEAAGVKAGDVVVKVNDVAVTTPPQYSAQVAGLKPGDTVRVELKRAGEAAPLAKAIAISPVPFEKSDDFDVVYGVATADGNRYRTILTKPKGNGPFPTLFIVQGVGCFSVDNMQGSFSYAPVVNDLTKRGYAILRVDKPGTGDSEGGPCTAVDFPTEVHAYQAALKTLAGKAFVDQKNVFLFGHSMGGFMAPMVATAAPLRGIAVYGTGFNSWLAYTLENTRRQMRLGGADYIEIADEEKNQELLTSLFYVQKLPLEEILAKHPQFREQFPDGGKTFAAGKNPKYFQQIYDFNMARQWKPYEGAVLSMWGGADFVSNESDHHWLADAINQWHPGRAEFRLLPSTDHWLHKAADFAASAKQGAQSGEFNSQFNDLLFAWMEKNRDRAAAR